jgi:hypothetical protein
MRVRYILQRSRLVIRFEGVAHLITVVLEVEPAFLWCRAVQAAQRLHSLEASQIPVDTHGAEFGLIEACLIFLYDNQQLKVIAIETLRQFRFGKAV